MNQENLKNILKPLIKQCIKEVIFEEGSLSKIVQEVVVGLGVNQQVLDEATPSPTPRADNTSKIRQLEETKKRMLDSIGNSSYGNVFENTNPLSSAGTPGAPSSSSPLASVDPSDPGVDIQGLFGGLSENWKKMV
jgi:hypothetical protein